MADERCFYYKNGNCTKGLTDTPCEVIGCVAHTDANIHSWKNMSESKTHYNQALQDVRT